MTKEEFATLETGTVVYWNNSKDLYGRRFEVNEIYDNETVKIVLLDDILVRTIDDSVPYRTVITEIQYKEGYSKVVSRKVLSFQSNQW